MVSISESSSDSSQARCPHLPVGFLQVPIPFPSPSTRHPGGSMSPDCPRCDVDIRLFPEWSAPLWTNEPASLLIDGWMMEICLAVYCWWPFLASGSRHVQRATMPLTWLRSRGSWGGGGKSALQPPRGDVTAGGCWVSMARPSSCGAGFITWRVCRTRFDLLPAAPFTLAVLFARRCWWSQSCLPATRFH